jgi:mitochondrial fission protein ELM1
MRRSLSIVCIGNGFAGAENQCSGLAELLQEKLEIASGRKVINMMHRILPRKGSWEFLPPSIHVMFAGFQKKLTWVGLESAFADFNPIPAKSCPELMHGPYPDVVIASGRTTVPACVAYRRASGGKTYTVQIQHPRCDLDLFDAIVAPSHDFIRRMDGLSSRIDINVQNRLFEDGRSNIICTFGSVHRINQHSLARSWKEQGQVLQPYAPRSEGKVAAILIGGPTSRCKWDKSSLLACLNRFLEIHHSRYADEGLSLLISLSRRSPAHLLEELNCWKDDVVKQYDSVSIFVWDPSIHPASLNPYQAMLCIADVVAVTADSVGMCSEACSLGKPVFTLLTDRCSGKMRFFHENLNHHGFTLRLDEHSPPPVSFARGKLNDTGTVAELLLPRILEHHNRLRSQ